MLFMGAHYLAFPTTGFLLLIFLLYSRHLREFRGFDQVPNASKIIRFKPDFLEDIPDEDKSVHDARLLIPSLQDLLLPIRFLINIF